MYKDIEKQMDQLCSTVHASDYSLRHGVGDGIS
jgi:hypothetical protein